MFDFERGLCADLDVSGTREWLVTNGIGGYACGTIAGLLTRRYHGLLVAALNPPADRTLLVTKLDETVIYDGQTCQLFTNRWAGKVIEPNGYLYLESFRLEGTTPVWNFACADALLEKRIWMQRGQNTTYVRYTLIRGTLPVQLNLKALVNYRDHHSGTRARDWQMAVNPVERGVRILPFDGAVPYYLWADRADAAVEPQHIWMRDYFLSVEDYRGFSAYEDHLLAASFDVLLQPGESIAIVASVSSAPNLDADSAYAEHTGYEKDLTGASQHTDKPEWWRQLILAADQFIVRRALPTDTDSEGRSVIAGYPWFSDWGRDTMISLPGLTLVTGRFDIAQRILKTFAHFVDQGMLPNRFPDAGDIPEYNTVDASLWYFEAIRAYFEATQDEDTLSKLFPVLEEIVDSYYRGTRYNIHVDTADGLLYAGEVGLQLTWMDAKVEDWVVTPRIGKPVEINALWYNVLRIMAQFAQKLGRPREFYEKLADQVQVGFGRFWNTEKNYCFDVVDGPYGADDTLRPNQLFAVSLFYSPLTAAQQKTVVDVCARKLLTSHGLRSLSPDDLSYVSHYEGDFRQRDGAYHQGTVWGWLIGPFVTAHLRVYHDPVVAQSFLKPLIASMTNHGVGSISEIFDGDRPFTARGCFAQAWSVAEVLRAWQATRTGGSER